MLNQDEPKISLSKLNLSEIVQMYFKSEVKSLTFQKGEVVVRKGQVMSGVYVVHSGALRIFTLDSNGIEKPIDNIRPGEMCLFSLECIMKRLSFPAWLKVDSPQAEIKFVSGSTFRKVYLEEPSLRDSIFEASLRRIYSMMAVIEKTLVYDIGARINHFLLHECPENNIIELSHQDIADRVGTSRESVSKHLKSMENVGCIKLERMKIIVNSLEGLAKQIPKHAL